MDRLLNHHAVTVPAGSSYVPGGELWQAAAGETAEETQKIKQCQGDEVMIDAFSFWLLLIACIVGTYILTPVLKRFEAYRKGYDKGHAEGHEEGFYEGFQEGLTDGIRIGEGRLKKAQHIDIKG